MSLNYEAYWIDPYGKIIPVSKRHHNLILDNPKKFGLTRKKIESIYKKHKEPMGLEGKAREEIMRGLLDKGWIRLRFIKTNYSWTAQLNGLTNKKKDYLFDFIVGMENGTLDNVNIDTMDINVLADRDTWSGSFRKAIATFFESKNHKRRYSTEYVLIEDYKPTKTIKHFIGGEND